MWRDVAEQSGQPAAVAVAVAVVVAVALVVVPGVAVDDDASDGPTVGA